MDRDGRLNVVDGPVLWRASSAGLLGRRKTGLLTLRSPLRGSAGDGFFKTMPVYYDDSAYGDHIFIFCKNDKPSTCGFINTNSGVVESSRFIVVNRHSFEMTLNR